MSRAPVCIVGAGIVGSATAYVLARAGHPVTLVEALEAPARATSFANGSQLSYSYVEPLATPSTLRKLPGLLLDAAAPLRVRLTGEWSQLAWGLRFLRACTPAQVERATRALLGLAFLSRDELDSACAADALEFDHARNGKLVIYQSVAALAEAVRQVEFQRRFGCLQSVLTPEECLEREPALEAYRANIAGGIWTGSEAVGDAHRLSAELIDRARAHGAQLRFRTRVSGFRRSAGRIVALRTDSGDELATPGLVVLANGNDAAASAAMLGLKLPIYPLKGYSVTLAIADARRAPSVSVTDLRRKIVYARLPGLLRIAGFAELVGRDLRTDPRRIAHLVACARETFPGACDFEADPHPWTGLRPATPTSLPIIGPTPCENLLVNAGHGALGFTLAMGSARLLERRLAGAADDALAAPFAYAAA